MPPSSSGLGLRPLTAPTPVQIRLGVRRCYNPNRLQHLAKLGCGVIGNTADSGSAILGSSPGTPANDPRGFARVFVFPGRISAVRIMPTCGVPVGDGQKRTRTFSGSSGLVFSASVIIPYCAASADAGEQQRGRFLVHIGGEMFSNLAGQGRGHFDIALAAGRTCPSWSV